MNKSLNWTDVAIVQEPCAGWHEFEVSGTYYLQSADTMFVSLKYDDGKYTQLVFGLSIEGVSERFNELLTVCNVPLLHPDKIAGRRFMGLIGNLALNEPVEVKHLEAA